MCLIFIYIYFFKFDLVFSFLPRFLKQTCIFPYYKEKGGLKIDLRCFGVLLQEKLSFASLKVSVQLKASTCSSNDLLEEVSDRQSHTHPTDVWNQRSGWECLVRCHILSGKTREGHCSDVLRRGCVLFEIWGWSSSCS